MPGTPEAQKEQKAQEQEAQEQEAVSPEKSCCEETCDDRFYRERKAFKVSRDYSDCLNCEGTPEAGTESAPDGVCAAIMGIVFCFTCLPCLACDMIEMSARVFTYHRAHEGCKKSDTPHATAVPPARQEMGVVVEGGGKGGGETGEQKNTVIQAQSSNKKEGARDNQKIAVPPTNYAWGERLEDNNHTHVDDGRSHLRSIPPQPRSQQPQRPHALG